MKAQGLEWPGILGVSGGQFPKIGFSPNRDPDQWFVLFVVVCLFVILVGARAWWFNGVRP